MGKTVLIITGETSGDMHAANLIRSIKTLKSDISFFGVGGEKMAFEGVEIIERMEKLSVIGIFEVFSKLPHIHRAYKKIMFKIKKTPPDAAVLIDYPGFNLAIAKKLKKKNIPVIYYITPQVWAWGKSRIYTIKKYVSKALVIFKFEEDLFKKYGIDATFVGHPILDTERKKAIPEKKSLGLKEKTKTVALLPGSREAEVKKMLPVMLEAASIAGKKTDIQFILLKSSTVDDGIYDGILKKSPVTVASIKNDTYGCLALSDFVFTSSGTATLESAVMERPMLITYKTSFITAIIFKFLTNTPFIGLVNIISKKEIAPEVLQYDAKPSKLASVMLSIILSPEKNKEQIMGLRRVKGIIGRPGASMRAARIISEFLK